MAGGGQEFRRTNCYYDGAQYAHFPLPTKGLLTAVSTEVDIGASSNVYTVYDSYGNPVKVSVATSLN